MPAPLILLGIFIGLAWAERRSPLRRRTEPFVRRIARNVAMGAMTGIVVVAIEKPLTRRVLHTVERRRFGFVNRLRLAPAARRIVVLLLLDYTLYVWHVLLHRVPLLWRAHRIHHADRDLDVTTALRFHASEFVLSAPWRALQYVVIGVDRRSVALWQALTVAEVMFHHSNLALPERFERALARVVATPRMHGIHHSDRADERHSNFSSGLSLWDFVHRTFRLDVPQRRIVIGLPQAEAAPPRHEPRTALALPVRRGGWGA